MFFKNTHEKDKVCTEKYTYQNKIGPHYDVAPYCQILFLCRSTCLFMLCSLNLHITFYNKILVIKTKKKQGGESNHATLY